MENFKHLGLALAVTLPFAFNIELIEPEDHFSMPQSNQTIQDSETSKFPTIESQQPIKTTEQLQNIHSRLEKLLNYLKRIDKKYKLDAEKQQQIIDHILKTKEGNNVRSGEATK